MVGQLSQTCAFILIAITNKKWIKNRAPINIFENISTFYKINIDLIFKGCFQ